MKRITPALDSSSGRPLYLQLYDYIKNGILSGELPPREKLPSLRSLAKSTDMSLTTVQLAYSQLVMEGYLTSKPNSGYYINEIFYGLERSGSETSPSDDEMSITQYSQQQEEDNDSPDKHFLYDMACFDFTKWKKCMNKVFNEQAQELLFVSDPQGELPLRKEIAKYLYGARGVSCRPEQILIGAGTQQITSYLASILQMNGIRNVSLEEPGYLPVKSIFRDREFLMTPVPMGPDGIQIDMLPSNIRSAVYVSPSNQFPTGSVMSISKRYELLDWAAKNNSIIIEDDYDSELRYSGNTVPALQGLRRQENVVYLGSFSSTLFASIKISYMVLPASLTGMLEDIMEGYTQTCSKAEQLTLASFMAKGYYQTGIKRLRNLYAQKLQTAISTMKKYGDDFITPAGTASGTNMLLEIKTAKTSEELCGDAASLGVTATGAGRFWEESQGDASAPSRIHSIILYYVRIPLDDIPDTIRKLIKKWRS